MLNSRKLGLIFLVLVLVASGCYLSNPREKIYYDFSRVNKEALNEELGAIWNDYIQSGEDEFFLPKDKWLGELRDLKPKRVFVNKNGIFILKHRLFVEVTGLFFLPDSSPFVPDPNGDPSYTLIEGNIYYYHFHS